MWWSTWILILTMVNFSTSSNILMVTMGGTKSHKIPFWELARGLTAKNHSVTFISAFPADFHMPNLEEISPSGLVFYVRNFTNRDLIGARIRGEEPIPYAEIVDFACDSCEMMYEDHEIKDFLASDRQYDLLVLDGAFPDCAFGFAYHFKAPYMLINTVAFHTPSFSLNGNPTPAAITPFFNRPFTNDMNLVERIENFIFNLVLRGLRFYIYNFNLVPILRKHFGPEMPVPDEFSKNVSFILQNGHHSVTYPRSYLPNVAEIACIHCKPAKPLNKELEDFINQGGDSGFIFVSMGSSVKTSNIPEDLRKLFIKTFARLPYQILWKWEDDREMNDLPMNVMTSRWLPQQDLLGHKKIRAFVTHGGLLSMFESVYHKVPIVTLPVFCDHESNAAKAEHDGYAIKLEFQGLTSEVLIRSINKVVHDTKYRENIKKRHALLMDQAETPLEKAVYWTEYVIRHKGANHFLIPGRNYNLFQFYSLDVILILLTVVFLFVCFFVWLLKSVWRYFTEYLRIPSKTKRD